MSNFIKTYNDEQPFALILAGTTKLWIADVEPNDRFFIKLNTAMRIVYTEYKMKLRANSNSKITINKQS